MASVKMLVVLVSIAVIVVSLSVVDALICKCSEPEDDFSLCPRGVENMTCIEENTTFCFKYKSTNDKIFEGCLEKFYREALVKNVVAEDGKCIIHLRKSQSCFCRGDLCIPPPFTEVKEEPDKGNETDKGNEQGKGKEILRCDCSGKLKGHPLCPGGLPRSKWTCDESDAMCFKARTVFGKIVEGCFNSSFRKYAAKYMVTAEAGKCYYDPNSTEEVCWCDSSLCSPPDFKGKGKDKSKGSAVLLRSWSWIPLSIFASSAIIVVPTFVGGQ